MVDLRSEFLGIKSPNPFWLASAPPTDRKTNVERAFRAGWGGVVWKTLGEAGPPVVNVSGARYGAIHGPDRRLIAFNNIELITDRDLEINLQEIKQVKREWPDRALVVSLMVPCDEESWKAILKRVEETECDGVELNFGCPHGMSERGMGSAVGQVPEYIEMVTRWCKQHTRMPVIVKLTPNITDVRRPARAAKAGGADAVSLINTINSIMGIDLDAHDDRARRRRQGHAWRHVRPGGEADRAVDGLRDRARRGNAGPADFGDRRRHDLARRGGVHRARRRHRAGLHRRDDLWLQDRRRDDLRPQDLHGREGLPDDRGFPRPRRAERDRLAISEPQLCREGRDRSGPLHQMRPLPHRLRGHLASGDLRRRSTASASSSSTRPNASAAISACSSARSRTASRSCTRPTGVDPRTGWDYDRPPLNWTKHPNNPSAPKAAESIPSVRRFRRIVLSKPSHDPRLAQTDEPFAVPRMGASGSPCATSSTGSRRSP